MAGYFVTGTDTGVGKTVTSLGLMQLLQDQGLRVVGMKPIASGCERTPDGLRNADALQLQQQSSDMPDYATVNPYAFEPAIAPHIAASQVGISIDLQTLQKNYQLLSENADRILVEGAGGWQVPLSKSASMADFARLLELPVILVVGIRLGCFNHALLTARAIAADGLRLAGWVANILPPVPAAADENISSLKSMVNAPLLGILPPLDDMAPAAVANHLILPRMAV